MFKSSEITFGRIFPTNLYLSTAGTYITCPNFKVIKSEEMNLTNLDLRQAEIELKYPGFSEYIPDLWLQFDQVCS